MVQTCALPIPLAFLLVRADAGPVTEGCSKKTCCTSLCYVDKHGVHHCVHKHNESCGCRVSGDDVSNDTALLNPAVTAPETENLTPMLRQTGWVFRHVETVRVPDAAVPSPPPK